MALSFLAPLNTQPLPSPGQAAECPGLQFIKDLCSLFGAVSVKLSSLLPEAAVGSLQPW